MLYFLASKRCWKHPEWSRWSFKFIVRFFSLPKIFIESWCLWMKVAFHPMQQRRLQYRQFLRRKNYLECLIEDKIIFWKYLIAFLLNVNDIKTLKYLIFRKKRKKKSDVFEILPFVFGGRKIANLLCLQFSTLMNVISLFVPIKERTLIFLT